MTMMSDETTDVVESDPDPILEVLGLKKHFAQSDGIIDRLLSGSRYVEAVNGVDLTIEQGETVALVGESGCGKSTLAQTIINLHDPTDGTVRFNGTDVTGLSQREMRQYRREMQMIFQDPLASLNPRQTVGEILKAPMEVHGIGANDEERTEIAKEQLTRVGLKEGHIKRYPNEFSGGQQQRIAIARVLTLEPSLLLADEPVSALDVSVQAQILNLLEELQAELGLSILFIAHDLSVVRYIADRVAVMYLGEIVEKAPTDELFENPQHPYTKSLLSAIPRIDPSDRSDRIILQGTVPSPIDPPSGCRFHTRCPEVIPPETWPASQPGFKAGFLFRNRIIEKTIDPDAIRDFLELEGGTVTDADVIDAILDESVPHDVTDLPTVAVETIREAATAIVTEDDWTRARELVVEQFPSPCEQEQPRSVTVDDDHTTSCHRLDPEAPGNRTFNP